VNLPERIIFHCKYCDDCWQHYEPRARAGKKTYYYSDFPTYGKIKKICPSCLRWYLKTNYIRINANIPINKYFVPKKQQGYVIKCFIPPKIKELTLL